MIRTKTGGVRGLKSVLYDAADGLVPTASPLTLLTKGESDRVVAAVRGDRQGDFA